MPKQPQETPRKWKTVSVRRKSLEVMRDAIRANPCPETFVPQLDVETMNESNVLDIACILAARQLCGKLFEEWFEKLRPEVERMVKLAQEDGMIQVARHFQSSIRAESDGSYSIVTNKDETALPPLQAPTLPTGMFH